jgi:predicted choloylglycine hydrolase
VVRTADGGLFHGWNNDVNEAQFEAKYTLIVQYHPTGYHTYTNVNTLLAIDGTAAYNDAGLRLTDKSLAGGRYKEGVHPGLLGRLIMEECETLDDVAVVLNVYSPMTATALLISDRNSGDAAVFDVVPNAQPTWGVTPLEHNALWTVNRFSDRRLAEEFENDFLSQQSYNAARTRLFQAFFHDADSRRYTLDDLIHAMRLRGNAETETFRELVDDSVCNVSTIKSIIHDAQGKGFYMAKGDGYFGAMAAWYFYPEKIAEPPQLYEEANRLRQSFGKLASSTRKL